MIFIILYYKLNKIPCVTHQQAVREPTDRWRGSRELFNMDQVPHKFGQQNIIPMHIGQSFQQMEDDIRESFFANEAAIDQKPNN